MKKLKPNHLIILLILSVLPLIFFGQNERNDSIASAADVSLMLYGNSDELYNGKIYLPPHSLAEGNPYYNDRLKINGTIFIKGNTYENQVFGYDIADEKVILSYFQPNGSQYEVELNEALIDSMIIGNTFFVNSALNIIPGFDKGFIEVVYHGGFLFVKKHKKTFMNQYNSGSPYGFYTKNLGNFYLITDSKPSQVNSNKMLLKKFESNQKEIKKYMKSVKFKFKKANNIQWSNLLSFIDKISSTD